MRKRPAPGPHEARVATRRRTARAHQTSRGKLRTSVRRASEAAITGELDAVGRAADDLVQHDDVGRPARRRIGDEIGGPEGRALAEAGFDGERAARAARSPARARRPRPRARPAASSSSRTWPMPPPISRHGCAIEPRAPPRAVRASARAMRIGPLAPVPARRPLREALAEELVLPVPARSEPGVTAAAEVAARDHRHHGDAVLVDHLAADPDRATFGPALGRRRLEHRQPSGERVAGPDRGEPAQLLDPGRAHAGRAAEQRVDVEPHPHRARVPAARDQPAESATPAPLRDRRGTAADPTGARTRRSRPR